MSAPTSSDAPQEGTSSAAAPSRKRPLRPWEEPGFKCPFLDTINRMVLDFDFEKACSVTGHNFNVYACLVCGKYFQGRGKHTQAYTHSLQEAHHVFMNLQDGCVYCLPDSYEVVDTSLQDIQNMLAPKFTDEKIATLDSVPVYSRGVDGSDYMPGLIGLNNIKHNDFFNVVVQVRLALAEGGSRIGPATPAAPAALSSTPTRRRLPPCAHATVGVHSRAANPAGARARAAAARFLPLARELRALPLAAGDGVWRPRAKDVVAV